MVGTWKNGQLQYAPEWIKGDPATPPRQLDDHGQPVDDLSTFAPATLAADQRAFTTLMAHLKKIGGDRRRVIAVQVENEPGTFGTGRDCSPAANPAFQAAVPASACPRHPHPVDQ
ncbi:MAG: hypothetical protein ACTHMG_05150 [Sphingomonas sp.]